MITILKIEKPKQDYHMGYKYIIERNYGAYAAYKTNEGFNDWIKRCDIKLEKMREKEQPIVGKLESFKCDVDIVDLYFRDLSEVPQEAKKYKGLCNGSIVDCYCKRIDDIVYIYRPNPNAKNVYTPMELQEHIAYQNING